MASGEALAYLTDYSTLQYYQTQLNCKLVVRLPGRSTRCLSAPPACSITGSCYCRCGAVCCQQTQALPACCHWTRRSPVTAFTFPPGGWRPIWARQPGARAAQGQPLQGSFGQRHDHAAGEWLHRCAAAAVAASRLLLQLWLRGVDLS